MRTEVVSRTITALLVVLVGASVTLGAGITAIGVLTPTQDGTVSSKVYAISADGQYAVGESNGQTTDGSATLPQAVVWSAASGLVQLPNTVEAPMIEQPASARGVVVKANGEIGIAAYHNNFPVSVEYRMYHYTATAGNLAGGTWVRSPGTDNLTIGTYNAARNLDVNGVYGDVWAIAGQRSNAARGVISRSDGGYSDSNSNGGHIYNVVSRLHTGSLRGYAAGYQVVSGQRRALFGVGGSTQTLLPGGSGYQSEALGMSPYTTPNAGSGVIVGYDQDTTAAHKSHAFYYTQGASGMTMLAEPTGADSSQAIDVRVIDGQNIIVGFATYGEIEEALIWDKTGIWAPAGDQAWSVHQLLINAGISTTGWASLSRVTSISDDGQTIGGWGIWTDGTTRGFVATIPEPASLLLLGLGGLAMLRRNRR